MKYKGLVLSDDLTMLGAGNDLCHEKVEKSLMAGCDMVLICNDRNGAKQAIDFLENKDIDRSIEIAKLNSETGLHDNELIYRDCDLLAISGVGAQRFTYIRNLEVGMHGVKSSIVLFQKTQTKKIPRLALPMDFGA